MGFYILRITIHSPSENLHKECFSTTRHHPPRGDPHLLRVLHGTMATLDRYYHVARCSGLTHQLLRSSDTAKPPPATCNQTIAEALLASITLMPANKLLYPSCLQMSKSSFNPGIYLVRLLYCVIIWRGFCSFY